MKTIIEVQKLVNGRVCPHNIHYSLPKHTVWGDAAKVLYAPEGFCCKTARRSFSRSCAAKQNKTFFDVFVILYTSINFVNYILFITKRVIPTYKITETTIFHSCCHFFWIRKRLFFSTKRKHFYLKIVDFPLTIWTNTQPPPIYPHMIYVSHWYRSMRLQSITIWPVLGSVHVIILSLRASVSTYNCQKYITWRNNSNRYFIQQYSEFKNCTNIRTTTSVNIHVRWYQLRHNRQQTKLYDSQITTIDPYYEIQSAQHSYMHDL